MTTNKHVCRMTSSSSSLIIELLYRIFALSHYHFLITSRGVLRGWRNCSPLEAQEKGRKYHLRNLSLVMYIKLWV